VLALLATALTLAASVLVAMRFAGGSVGTLLVAAYVLWVGQIVGLSLVLSAFDRLGRPGYLVAAAIVTVAAAVVQVARPAPVPPLRATTERFAAALRADPIVAFLGVVVALELVYVTLIAVLTPPVDDDSLQYHLGRPALWLQQGSLGTFPDVHDFRLNAFPVNAELVYGFFLATGDGDRFVAVSNVLAALALTVGVAVGARRLGFEQREALFGALLAASLPVVALQAPSTLTDLGVAALVTSATALFLRRRTADLVLGAVASGLLVGAKVTGVFALPVLAVVVAGTWWSRRWRALGAFVGAVAIGGYWYWWNLAREGTPLGETASDQRGGTDPLAMLARMLRIGVNAFDLPGAVGADRWLYPIAALVVIVVVAGLALRDRRRVPRDLALTAIVIAAVPLILPLGRLVERAYQKLFITAGHLDLASLDTDRVETVASSMQSGAGPVGLVLFVVATAALIGAIGRRDLDRRVVAFALAPIAWVVLIGAGVAYFRWNARFTLPGFALAAMTWGIVLRTRWLALATTVVAAVTLALSFVHFFEKPAGIRLLAPRSERSAFTTPRPDQMAWDPRVVPLLRYLDRDLPQAASVASFPVFYPRRRDLQPDDAPELLTYLLFGRHLDRHVDIALDPAAAARAGAEYYLAPTETLAACVTGWNPVAERSNWTILRRMPGRVCAP